MPEKDKIDSDDPSPGSQAPPVHSAESTSASVPEYPLSVRAARRTRVGNQIRDATSQLLLLLQLRLDRLQAMGDSRSVEIAIECEKVLAEIREQIRALGDDVNELGVGND